MPPARLNPVTVWQLYICVSLNASPGGAAEPFDVSRTSTARLASARPGQTSRKFSLQRRN